MSTEKLYVVIKRGLFWRPEDKGYTSEINEAGRYTKEEAQDRCHGGEQPVTMALASEFQTTESIKAENSQLRTDLAALEAENRALREALVPLVKYANDSKLIALSIQHFEEAVRVKRLAEAGEQALAPKEGNAP